MEYGQVMKNIHYKHVAQFLTRLILKKQIATKYASAGVRLFASKVVNHVKIP